MSPANRRTFLTQSLSSAAALTLAGASGRACAQGISTKLPKTTVPALALPPGIKTIQKMPRSTTEVARAHLDNREEAAEFLQGGELLEFNSFALKLTRRDGAPPKGGKLPNPSTRRFMLSVGIDLKPADQARLPTLSKDKILEYLQDHYVSVQARVQKDARGSQYLHHRCIVMTGTFRGGKLSEDFQPAVANSVREIHALGLYLPAKSDPTPENLRTAVLVHKHTGIDIAAKKTRPEFEFIIVRGRQQALGALDLYCFVTTEQRTKLHLLKSAQKPPTKYAECSLKAQVYFTRFDDTGLTPSESVVRNQSVISQASFAIKDLDALVKSQLRLSDTFTNLNETLDAIIDGKLKPADQQVPTTTAVAQPKVVAPANTATGSKK
jgi:hypothetical protein